MWKFKSGASSFIFFFFSALCTHFSPHMYTYTTIYLYIYAKREPVPLCGCPYSRYFVTRARNEVNEEGQKESITKYVSTESKRMAVVM